METLKKYPLIDASLKGSLQRVGDLINIDGPMLALFKDARNGDIYLFDWVDDDDKSNRWLIYKASKKDISDFIKKKISYKSLFSKNANNLFVADIENDEIRNYEIFRVSTIPDSYRPDKDAFFDTLDCKNIENIKSVLEPITIEKENIREHNVINVDSWLYHGFAATQRNNIDVTWADPGHNVLSIIIKDNRTHTQLVDAPKSNKIPRKKGMVLQ